MTRRIVLTLADDTTATECGMCRHVAIPDRILGTRVCARPEFRDPNDALPVVWLSGRWVGRADACLAAEAAASRMVEIAPDDADTIATIVDDWNRRYIPEADLPESIARIRDVLRDHAGPDR